MAIDSQVVKDAAATSPSIDRRPALHERPALRFVYRESPLALVPLGRGATVGISDPPFDVAGMVTVILDSTGKLVRYARVPEAAPVTSREGETVDWTPYFAFAGLDRNRFRGLPQAWTVPVEADSKHAWVGTTAANPATHIEVHAASLAGKPVLFEALAATRPAATAQNFRAPTTIEEFTGVAGFAVIFVAALIVAAFVARRNLQLGKGDRAAARKVASLVLACLLVAGLLSADHSRDPAGEWGILIAVAGNALSHAGAIWLFYIAAEPYVRRRQPELLISWNRILRGNLRDSLVGRDVLIGCLLGALLHISYAHLIVFVPHWVGMPVPLPDHSFPEKLTGGGWPLVSLAALLGSVPRDAVGALFLFSLCRSVLRADWLAFGVVTFLSTIPHLGRDVASSAEVPFVALAAAIFVFALSRVSLLSGMVTLFVGSWFAKSVFVFDPRSWLFLPTLFYVAVTVALFLYGFRTSLGLKRALGRLRFAE